MERKLKDMKSKFFLIAVILSMLLITGCGNNTVKVKNGGEHENVLQNMGRLAETDDGYYIIAGGGFCYMDKVNHKLSPVCRDATCDHLDEKCLFGKGIYCVKNYNGHILLICRDFYNAKNNNIIYELNQDTYELSEFYKMDTDYDIGYFEISGRELIVSLGDIDAKESGWYIENMDTGERRMLLDRPTYRNNIGMDDEYIYISTQELEIYKINLKTTEKTLVSDDYCREPVLYQNRIYYLGYNIDAGYGAVYSVNTDGTDKKMIRDNVFSFRVWDDRIYFITDTRDVKAGDIFGMMNLDGSNEKILVEDQNLTYNIFILPEEKAILCFNSIDVPEEYNIFNQDGEQILNGEVPVILED